MTANNVLLHPNAGYLYSDAAVQSRHEWGLIQQIRSKLFILPKGPAAVTLRGSVEPFEEILPRLEAIEGGAALAAAAPGIVRACCSSLPDLPFTLTLVVWLADLGEPAGYAVSRDGSVRVLRAPGMSYHPPVEGEDLAHVLTLVSNPLVFGEELMERQRALKLARGTDRPSSIVGGFCEMATIGPDGVETEILRTWPDIAGGYIAPAPRDLVAGEWSPTLNVSSIGIDNTTPSPATGFVVDTHTHVGPSSDDPGGPDPVEYLRFTFTVPDLRTASAVIDRREGELAWVHHADYNVRPGQNVIITGTTMPSADEWRLTLRTSDFTASTPVIFPDP